MDCEKYNQLVRNKDFVGNKKNAEQKSQLIRNKKLIPNYEKHTAKYNIHKNIPMFSLSQKMSDKDKKKPGTETKGAYLDSEFRGAEPKSDDSYIKL